MAKTRAKRRRKHRGTQAGTVQRPLEARGRGRAARGGADDKAARREAARRRRAERMDRPPTWRSSATRAALASLFVAVVLIALGNPPQQAILLALVALAVYVPLGYLFDGFVYRLRQRRKGAAAGGGAGGSGRSDRAKGTRVAGRSSPAEPGDKRRGRARGDG